MTAVSIPRPASGLGIAEYMAHASVWSFRTFGPGARQTGIVAHIRKELAEIEAVPDDLSEWADLFILALDGCWRTMTLWPKDDVSGFDWSEVEDDILDLLVCGDDGDRGVWPDTEAVNVLLNEIEGVPISPDGECRAPEFLFGLIALEAIRGARYLGAPYAAFREAVWDKLERNIDRQWPDWRTMSPDLPIEHIRGAGA